MMQNIIFLKKSSIGKELVLRHHYRFYFDRISTYLLTQLSQGSVAALSNFHNFCSFRSRTKNLMWYGVLGGKEILQKTFKNLDQRVQLECDGQRIPLPSLQGIVIMNIPRWIHMLEYGTAHSHI